MHIMDLVLQGVGKFVQSRKFPLKPGFNVVFGPVESGKTTLVSSILTLLFPRDFRSLDQRLASRGEVPASHAGLTLASGKDIYRVLKELKKGSISLSQYNPASQKFEPVSTDPEEISALLSEKFALPTAEVFTSLFTASADAMPSVLPLVAEDEDNNFHMPEPAAGPAPQAGSSPGQPAVFPGATMPPGMMTPGAGAPPGMTPPQPAPGMWPGQPMPPGMFPGQSMPGYPPGTMAPGMFPGMPGMMSGPGFPAMEDDGMTPEEREARLKQLREELKTAEKVEELQFEIDGLQRKLFDIEAKIKSTTQFDEFLTQAKEQLDKYPAFRRLPPNIDQRLDGYKDLQAKQAAEVEKIDQQALKFDEEYRFLKAIPPLYQQQLFLAGAGLLVGGVAIAVLAQYLPMLQSLRLLGLLSFGGVGLLFWVIWQHIEKMSEKTRIEEKLEELEEKKQSIIRRFQAEMAVIEKLMNDTESESVDELKEKIQKYRELEAKYQSVKERKNKLIKEINLEAQEKKREELKKKIESLEEELKKYPPISMSLHEIKQEVQRLEKIIRMTNPNSPLLQEAGGVPEPEAALGKADAGTTQQLAGPAGPYAGPDPSSTRVLPGASGARKISAAQAYENMIQAAAAIFSIERKQLLKHINQRFNLYLQALFAKRYNEGRIDPDGSVALKLADTGRWVDFDQLTPAARDTAFLALQITLLELVSQRRILPVILDNPFRQLDEIAAQVATKAFKRIGERTQVIFFSSQRAPLSLADHSLSLS